MTLRVARLWLAAFAGLAVVGLVHSTFAQESPDQRQAGDDERAVEQIRATQAAIGAAQAAEGPRSPSLIKLLTDLGVLFGDGGDHALATAALEEARHVVRANYGLHTLEQLPLLQQALANQQALGNIVMVDALEEELLDLAQRHPEDLRTVAIHRDVAERRMGILRRLLAGDAPPEIYPEVGIPSFLKDEVIEGLVSAAQLHYASAAAVLLRNQLYSSEELRELEMEIVRSSDFVRRRYDLSPSTIHRDSDAIVVDAPLEAHANAVSELAGFIPSPGIDQRLSFDGVTSRYELGRNSYRRLIAYNDRAYGESSDAAALRERLQAYLALADWDLLYSRNGRALDQYGSVLELLTSLDFAEQLTTELFAPPVPTVLPTFEPNPFVTPESPRYIDVAFEVTRYGEGRRIEVLGASPGVADAAKKELVALIEASHFRPRATDGKLGRASPVNLRYYLND